MCQPIMSHTVTPKYMCSLIKRVGIQQNNHLQQNYIQELNLALNNINLQPK